MSLKNFHWGWAKQRFGIWGVRDYYAFLDQMAKEGAKITFGYILVVLASAFLATAGLLLDSPAIIIGSMCVAPFLGPSRAVCIGGLFREWRVFWRGLFKQIFGLLFVGSVTAYLITILLQDTVAGVDITKEILLRAMPAEKDLVLAILTAVGAGAAASLALSADPRIVAKPWGQIIDAMIGVEIAISLIPPACVVGMGFAFNRMDISRNALWLLLVNVVGLDFLGSMMMLTLRGVRRRYLDLESEIRQTVVNVVVEETQVEATEIDVNVVLLAEEVADIHATIRCVKAAEIFSSLAEAIASSVDKKVGSRSQVTVENIPCVRYSTLKEEEVIERKMLWR
jgi:uncharacterized hydrophobic protein (TIGR00271 family)